MAKLSQLSWIVSSKRCMLSNTCTCTTWLFVEEMRYIYMVILLLFWCQVELQVNTVINWTNILMYQKSTKHSMPLKIIYFVCGEVWWLDSQTCTIISMWEISFLVFSFLLVWYFVTCTVQLYEDYYPAPQPICPDISLFWHNYIEIQDVD